MFRWSCRALTSTHHTAASTCWGGLCRNPSAVTKFQSCKWSTQPNQLKLRTIPTDYFPHTRPVSEALRCTVFDATGKVVDTTRSIGRKQLIQQFGLQNRDLRHIDGPAALVPRIMVHRGNILVNVCDLRVLIRKDSVFVFHSNDPAIAERLSLLVYDFQDKLQRRPISTLTNRVAVFYQNYEQRALEVVLIHALAFLEVDLSRLLGGVESMLSELENHTNRDMLKELLTRSKDLQKFYRKCLAVRNALDDVLNDDEDIAEMFLSDDTDMSTQREGCNNIELLVETYFKQADELVQKAGKTVRDVETTEELINTMIDANRNSLLLYRLEVSILTVGLGLAVFMSGLYGMNLANWIEETDWGMAAVCVVILLVSTLGTLYNFRTLHRARQVFMPTDITYDRDRLLLWKWLTAPEHHGKN